jgi:hypothetical protein
MRIAVLADDDGQIVAIAKCRYSPSGRQGTFSEDAEIRAEIRRSALDAYRGRTPSSDPDTANELITSITMELPAELHNLSIGEIQREMILVRSGQTPVLSSKSGAR